MRSEPGSRPPSHAAWARALVAARASRRRRCIPIVIVLSALAGSNGSGHLERVAARLVDTAATRHRACCSSAPLLMILFRQKYPRWWFDWNLELLRFTNRVGVYARAADDAYPSTDEEQSVHLELPVPRRRDGPQPLAAARQVAARDPALHRAVLPLDRRDLRGRSSRGSRSSSRAATRAGSSTTSSASGAGTTASPPTPSCSSPTSTRRSGWLASRAGATRATRGARRRTRPRTARRSRRA